MLSDKYAPTTLNGIIGNGDAVKRLMQFGACIHSGKKIRPLLLYGPTGTGKTAAAHALAYANSFELIEFSSSNYRDGERLRKLLHASRNRGLFSKNMLILLDEIDELSGRFDTGAESAISKLIEDSRQPIIFTAEDYWDQKISFLRNRVEKVEFRKVGYNEVLGFLESTARKEGKMMDREILDAIAKRCSGDVRAALNDLEAMLDAKPDLMENMGIRDSKLEVFGVLDKIFLSSSFDAPRNAMARSDLDIGMLINWVDENIPRRFFSKTGIRNAYANVARASLFLEKASRTNYWGYLRYASILLGSGVALSNPEGRVSMLKTYSFPSNIKYMSATKKERLMLNEIAARLSPMLHSSRKYIVNEYLPLFRIMLESAIKKRGKEEVVEQAESAYNIYEEEIDAILSITKSRGS